ncbi:MAG TPA: hypothetical protein VE398_08585 [Acidobacteriota bacterium]|nr:hypothetical protein [Acidobacteriota bacterium]
MSLAELLEQLHGFDFATLIVVGIVLFHCIAVSTFIVNVVRRHDLPDEVNQPWWGQLSAEGNGHAVSAAASHLWQRLVQFINAEHEYKQSSPLLEYLEDVWPSVPPFERGDSSQVKPVWQKQARVLPVEIADSELEGPLLVEDLPATATKGSVAVRTTERSPRSSRLSKST